MRDTIDTAGLYLSDRMWADDTDGEVDSPTGYFALVTDITHDTFVQVGIAFDDEQVATLTPADFGEHVVITGDSQGFIYVESFDTADEATRKYNALQDDYGVWLGVEPDDDMAAELTVALAQSAAGQTRGLGDFTQYIEH